MISMNRLLMALSGLVAIDIVLTYIAVGRMGAIELNPLVNIFGFEWSMLLKTLLSLGAIYVFYRCAPAAPRLARTAVGCLVVIYGGVAASNIYQLYKVIA